MMEMESDEPATCSRSICDPRYLVTPTICVATLAKKKDANHCFLVLERLDMVPVPQAEPATSTTPTATSTAIANTNTAKSKPKLEPRHSVVQSKFGYVPAGPDANSSQQSRAEWSGEGRVVTGQITRDDLTKMFKDMEGVSYQITKTEYNKIVGRLSRDKRSNAIKYTLPGNSSVSSISPAEMHNCVSYMWAVLRDEAGVAVPKASGWWNWWSSPFNPIKSPEKIIGGLRLELDGWPDRVN